MFSLFIVLLSFSESLATKCLFLNDERWTVRSIFVDVNPNELKDYPFMISLNTCTGCCNVLSSILCVLEGTKDIGAKAFNMITNKDKAKAITEHISCDCQCKFNSTICNSFEWNNKTCQSVKIIVSVRKTLGIMRHLEKDI